VVKKFPRFAKADITDCFNKSLSLIFLLKRYDLWHLSKSKAFDPGEGLRVSKKGV